MQSGYWRLESSASGSHDSFGFSALLVIIGLVGDPQRLPPPNSKVLLRCINHQLPLIRAYVNHLFLRGVTFGGSPTIPMMLALFKFCGFRKWILLASSSSLTTTAGAGALCQLSHYHVSSAISSTRSPQIVIYQIPRSMRNWRSFQKPDYETSISVGPTTRIVVTTKRRR